MQHFDEVGSLAAAGLHRGVRGAQVGLVEETDVVDRDALGLVVLEVLDELVCVALSPIFSVALCGGIVDSA